ncbi:MAG: ABC transporter ATP-binding protein, partial [Kiritimatiellae bacterium]|nr:ABC transporter ATP-binding protein [Kiritimatiellia bacterium]
ASVRSSRCPDPAKAVDDVIKQAKLEGKANQTIETLSKGYRQRTAFAAAILHDPKVLIMDEPTDGLDPNQKFTVREMIKDMASRGKAIIISTHILEEVDAVCSKVVVISDGEVKFEGTPEGLKAQDPSGNGRLDEAFRELTKKEG